MSTLTQSPTWRAFAAHHASFAHGSISELFANDHDRVAPFSLEAAALHGLIDRFRPRRKQQPASPD
ncbi:hypothetical protein EVC45_13580 [Paraburkholderia sp. UYCP14C]|uniref:hypothetical protein n=1 Tax=Paraburkholderia sp. UYCP14C TaxID=2511130 RepID=UPI00101F9223|nr:hypothetical protein [Paraburkholderia sp. UYCP14C]RZF29151.1 hypothetical protein EVC45_13580 [Paraburkholderia sp. UYCP14C]